MWFFEKKHSTLTTVIPKTITNAKEPNPMTTTAMAQSGIPPTSSSAMEGACSSLATTEKKKKKSWKQKFLLDRLTRLHIFKVGTSPHTQAHILCLVENLVIICNGMYNTSI